MSSTLGGASKAFAGADMSVRVPNTRAGKSGTAALVGHLDTGETIVLTFLTA